MQIFLEFNVQHIPFINLNTIDLTNNWITQDSSVMPLICWPALINVVLTANTISLKKNLTTFMKMKSTFDLYNIKIKR